MVRFAGALVTSLVISGVAVYSQAQPPVTGKPGTEKITVEGQQKAKNLIQDVSTMGCIRLWKPAPDDPTRMPPDRQPGLAGIYLLTPLASAPLTDGVVPTYLLTPSATLNFSQNVGKQVEITGTAQAAPLPPTVQEIATPSPRPEEKPSTNGMPRLTVTTLKVVAESCP
jgi:hypothetical protein